MFLERIQRVSGTKCVQKQFASWALGLAIIAATALVMLSTALAKAQSVKSSTDRVPSLAGIAKANDAAWAAIQSVDLEYETTEECMVNGEKVRVRSPPPPFRIIVNRFYITTYGSKSRGLITRGLLLERCSKLFITINLRLIHGNDGC